MRLRGLQYFRGIDLTRSVSLSLCTFLLVVVFSGNHALSEEKNKDTEGQTGFSFQEVYKKYYKDPGTLSKESYDWVQQDIANIGAWEYRTETFTLKDTTKLNNLGQEKWELIWIQSQGDTLVGIFKRPKRSYLKSLPAKDMMNILNSGS